MNRRTILTILTGGATVLYSRFASAGNSDPSSPIPSWPALRLNGKAGRASGPFPDLKSVGTDRQVRSIAYSRGAYRVTMQTARLVISWKALSASKSIRAISGLAPERRSFCLPEPTATDFMWSSPRRRKSVRSSADRKPARLDMPRWSRLSCRVWAVTSHRFRREFPVFHRTRV